MENINEESRNRPREFSGLLANYAKTIGHSKEKMYLDLYIKPYTKINWKMNHRPKYKN